MAVVEGHGPYQGALKGAADGGTIWWVAPSYGIANSIWRDLKACTRDAWVDKDETERRIQLPGGGSVTVKSGWNPDSLRGDGLDGVVLDEAADLAPDVWGESIRPALSDKQGWSLHIGTPKGQNHFFDLYEAAAHREDWKRFSAPTSANPLIPKSEIIAAKLDMGSLEFLQEYEAQFISGVGSMFDRDWFNVVDSIPDGLKLVRCWDLAATDSKDARDPDYTAGALVGRSQRGEWYVADIIRVRESPGAVEARIRNTAERDGRAVDVYIEQEPGSAGKTVLDHFIRTVLSGYSCRPFKPTGAKSVRAQPLSAAAENGLVHLLRGPWNKEFLDEAVRFPASPHDDQVDAVSMGVAVLSPSTQAAGPRRLVQLR